MLVVAQLAKKFAIFYRVERPIAMLASIYSISSSYLFNINFNIIL
jgi:hypothetical protein